MSLATVKAVKPVKPIWKILSKHHVSRGVGYSQETDFIVITETCVVVIEAKSYRGKIITDRDEMNNQWFCQTGNHLVPIKSCWGKNPFLQCDRYTKSVLTILQDYPHTFPLWREFKDAILSPIVKSLLNDHLTFLDFNGETFTIGLSSPELAKIANETRKKAELIKAANSLYPHQTMQVAIAHIPRIPQIPKIPVYGAIVFPRNSDISQISHGNHPHIREIGTFYRVTTVDYLLWLLDCLELEAAQRTNYYRFSPLKIENLLCDRPINSRNLETGFLNEIFDIQPQLSQKPGFSSLSFLPKQIAKPLI